jgi:predicted phage tail protein
MSAAKIAAALSAVMVCVNCGGRVASPTSPTPSSQRVPAGRANASLDVTAPDPPTNLVATVIGNSVTLTWKAAVSSTPVFFVIEAGSTPGAANLASLRFPGSPFSTSGVASGTYYVRVRATSLLTSATSAPSNEAILVVGGAACTTAPNAPSGLTSAASGGTVTLTWNPPSGGCAVTSYVLQAGSAAGLSNLANSNTGNTATSFIAPGVGVGTYFVRILAANTYGQSAASNESTLVVGRP